MPSKIIALSLILLIAVAGYSPFENAVFLEEGV